MQTAKADANDNVCDNACVNEVYEGTCSAWQKGEAGWEKAESAQLIMIATKNAELDL